MNTRFRRFALQTRHCLGLSKAPSGPYPSGKVWQWMEWLLLGLDCLAFPEFYLWLNRVAKPNLRRLSVSETALARSIFGQSIRYECVWVDERAVIACRRYGLAYVSGNLINSWGPLTPAHFIHEMVHIWQFQHLGLVYIPRALYAQRTPEGYDYGGPEAVQQACSTGKSFLDFNYEQQGDLVADLFRMTKGEHDRFGQKGGEEAYAAYVKVVKEVFI